MLIVTASPDKQFPSQSKPSAANVQDPSSVVASALKLQASAAVHPATPQSPNTPVPEPPAPERSPTDHEVSIS